MALVLTLANLACGQVAAAVSPAEAPVEIIVPGPVMPDTPFQSPPETHAPEAPIPPEPRFSVEAEYLLWFTKPGQFPALLTTGLNTHKVPGALDNPNTRVLFGGPVNYQERNGGRFSLGYVPSDATAVGLEAGYLFLGNRSVGVQPTSSGSPVLARPFFNVATNAQDASLSAYPGLISGTLSVRTASAFQGAEGNCTVALWRSERCQVDALAGFRYWHLDEDLAINENTLVGAGAPAFGGNTIRVADLFDADNAFYGGQLGLRGCAHNELFQVELTTKLALGCSQEIAVIRGATAIDTAPFANAGLLALASNSGRFARNDFAAIPEIGINIRLCVTRNIQLLAGYTFMYWANVLRPGDQIDTRLNPNLIPTSNTFGVAGGSANPALALQGSSFWAQGLNLGLQVRY